MCSQFCLFVSRYRVPSSIFLSSLSQDIVQLFSITSAFHVGLDNCWCILCAVVVKEKEKNGRFPPLYAHKCAHTPHQRAASPSLTLTLTPIHQPLATRACTTGHTIYRAPLAQWHLQNEHGWYFVGFCRFLRFVI